MLDGDEWIINGNKVFTSGANQADYVWLACRTDPDAAQAQGHLDHHRADVVARLQDHADRDGRQRRHAATFYDDMRVPKDNVVGERDGGWRLITTQLNHERVGLAALAGLTFALYDDMLEWAPRPHLRVKVTAR